VTKDSQAPTHRIERAAQAAQATGLSLLVVGDTAVTWHPLPASGSVVIGRGDDVDVRIQDAAISRAHARLDVGPPLRIEDLGSANGVWVGRSRVEPGHAVVITSGEPVELGTITIVVQQGGVRAGQDGWVRAGPGPAVLVVPGTGRARATPRDQRIVAEDLATRRVLELVERVAPSTITVLLLGETGVGKEVVAEALHAASGRSGRFVKLNCAAISPALLEGELFGHERGAFTGADRARPGLVETADHGTLLLDEVGELPLELQAKLLRVLEEREVLRVGGREARRVDVRFVAATHRDLREAAERGTFRRDLYYRLNGVAIEVPALRARPADVMPLAMRFLAPTGKVLSERTLSILLAYAWPGNVRELRNAVERAALLAGPSPLVEPEHLPPEILDYVAHGSLPPSDSPPRPEDPGAPADPESLSERDRILWALEECAGNQTRAAKLLGISRRTLVTRLGEHGIRRPRK